MEFQNCVSCGAADGMVRFEGETMPVYYRHFTRQVHGLSGWVCRECSEAEFDPQSAVEYGRAGDQLLVDAKWQMSQDMRRIRRKLNLTQLRAVEMLSGGGHNAFSRYERAEVEPPKPLMVLMALLDKHPELLHEIGAIATDLEQRSEVPKRRVTKKHDHLMPMATPHM